MNGKAWGLHSARMATAAVSLASIVSVLSIVAPACVGQVSSPPSASDDGLGPDMDARRDASPSTSTDAAPVTPPSTPPADGAMPVDACEAVPAPMPVDPAPGAPLGHLDSPTEDGIVGPYALVRGWAAGTATGTDAELFVDGEMWAALPLSSRRPDVCDAYPDVGCGTLGFEVRLDFRRLDHCPHLFELVTQHPDGTAQVVGRQRVQRVGQAGIGPRRSVHRIEDARITQALDMIVTADDEVVACFGSWRSTRGWDAHCRNLMTGAEERGAADHETAGVGLALGPSGPLVGFEADSARRTGGPATFGRGIRMNDGAHFWQSVSVGHGFAIAAAARIDGWNSDIFLGEESGEGAWGHLATEGLGVPHRQTFVDPYHLIFTTRYQGSGVPRLIRVDADRNVTVRTYTGLPAGCEGVGTAEIVEGVGLVAGTYSDQLPWRGGSCAEVGLLNPETGATTGWQPVGGADVIDILDLGDGFFAATANFPARVMLFSPELERIDLVSLPGEQVGGLAVQGGELYAASAGHGWAEVFAYPLAVEPVDPPTEADPETPPAPGSEMHFNLVMRQTVQPCSGCGLWFDPQGNAAKEPRLVVRYRDGGREQTHTYQHASGDRPLEAYYLAPPGETGPRSSHQQALLIKESPARIGLVYVDLSDIPPGAEILEARLHLHLHTHEGLANSDRESVLRVSRGVRRWDFDTVDWNQTAAGVPWTTPGGDEGSLIREIRADRDLWGRGFNKANPDADFDFTAHVTALQEDR